jgi:hypothetical protein
MKILENSKINYWNPIKLWKFQRTSNLAPEIWNNYENSREFQNSGFENLKKLWNFQRIQKLSFWVFFKYENSKKFRY